MSTDELRIRLSKKSLIRYALLGFLLGGLCASMAVLIKPGEAYTDLVGIGVYKVLGWVGAGLFAWLGGWLLWLLTRSDAGLVVTGVGVVNGLRPLKREILWREVTGVVSWRVWRMRGVALVQVSGRRHVIRTEHLMPPYNSVVTLIAALEARRDQSSAGTGRQAV